MWRLEGLSIKLVCRYLMRKYTKKPRIDGERERNEWERNFSSGWMTGWLGITK